MSYTPKISNQLDYYQRASWRGTETTAPTTDLNDGDTYFNTSDYGIYFYYDGTWYLLHTLVVAVDFLLLETGDILLKEDGDKDIIE